MTERTALYRFYRSAGSPLYFDITNNIKVRFGQHRREKSWWPDVDHAWTRVEWFDNRDEAETAEMAAIRTEQPEHNIVTSDEHGCARFLPNPTGRKWGRPKWSPDAEQAQAIKAVVDLYHLKQRLKEEYKALLAELADPNGDDVPVAHLAQRLGMERKTVYRHLGRQMK